MTLSADPSLEPQLHAVVCPGAAGKGAAPREMRCWVWQSPTCAAPDHVVVCVHGLTRQGRDFDVLARSLATDCTVIAVDVAGRGRSDWLGDPSQYGVPTYVADHVHLLKQLTERFQPRQLDWVGTSMGGLIGIGMAALPAAYLATPIRRMVLNDVGPTLALEALRRIGTYVGKSGTFESLQAGADALWKTSSDFGPHTAQQWLDLSTPMLVAQEGRWALHYDPAIGLAFQGLDQSDAAAQVDAGNEVLWTMYEAITAEVLVLRGAESDLLSEATLQEMRTRGPKAQSVEFAGVGHAPTLIAPDQVAAVRAFLLS